MEYFTVERRSTAPSPAASWSWVSSSGVRKPSTTATASRRSPAIHAPPYHSGQSSSRMEWSSASYHSAASWTGHSPLQ